MVNRWICFAFVVFGTAMTCAAVVRSQQILETQLERESEEHRLTPVGEVAHPFSAVRCKLVVGNTPRTFVVDSGATINFIDHSLEHHASGISRRVSVKTASNPIDGRIYEKIAASLSGKQVALKPVATIDIDPLSRALGDDIAGILGLPIILEFGLGYSNSSESFYLGRALERRFKRSYRLDINAKKGIFAERVHMGIGDERFLIDTGMNVPLAVSNEVFDQLTGQGMISSNVDTIVLDASGENKLKKGVLQRLSVWGTEFTDVPVLRSDENTLGLGLLQKFDFYIDPYNEQIELSENATTRTPFRIGKAGLAFVLDDEAIRVVYVEPGSPADSAGIAVGDELNQIGNYTIQPDWMGICQAGEALSREVNETLSVKAVCRRKGILYEFNIESK